MTNKGGKGGVGGVKSATHTRGIEKTESIGEVGAVKATGGVGAVRGTGGIGKRRSTRVMTLEEREALLSLISEEADKMFAGTGISPQKKELVTNAVKMAVDSSLLPEDEIEKNKK